MSKLTLAQQIKEDMKETMRSKDKERLGTIRLLMAAIKQREVDERITLNDADILTVIAKMIKQRQESIVQYKQAQREDLVAKEQAEIRVLELYLPAQLSDQELAEIIAAAIKEVGASSMQDMGKVMAVVKPKVAGRADVGKVSQQVKSSLS